MKKKILLFSCDPGGSNTIIPLVKPLIKHGYKVKLYGKDGAMIKYRQNGLNGIDITKIMRKSSLSSISKFLLCEKPNLIVTGTSSNDFTEKFIWKAAEKFGIHSFAILDQWMNYGIRFSSYSASQRDEYGESPDKSYTPTKILVMDELAKKEMFRLGFNRNKIVVTGHPFYELVKKKGHSTNSRQKNNFRKKIGIKGSDYLITYVSEPLTETYGNKNSVGYTELTIFKELIRALENISDEAQEKIILMIRIHPRENADKYLSYVRQKTEKIEIKIDRKSNPWDLVLSSQLVCGMTSTLLIESVILGIPILSVQIGLREEDSFILSKSKQTRIILSQCTLTKALKSAIIDSVSVKSTFSFISNSINLILLQIKKQLYGPPCS